MNTQKSNPANTLQVSVIIVNWKVRDLLRECIASLYANAGLAQSAMQVFVVDNDSQDGSVEMLHAEFPRVKVIANKKNIGFGAANNQVLERCLGEYILLLNPDTLCSQDAILIMLAYLETHPRVAIVGPRLENADGSLQRWTGGAYPNLWNVACHYLFLNRLFSLLPHRFQPAPLYLEHDVWQPTRVGWISGACLMLRRKCISDTIFNPHFFMYGEDMELCHRISQQGYEVIYLPQANIIHFQGASMKQQQGEVLLSSLKGPRDFYRMTHGERFLSVFDWLTLSGFFLRWLLYKIASLGSPRSSKYQKAQSSMNYMRLAWKIKNAPTKMPQAYAGKSTQ